MKQGNNKMKITAIGGDMHFMGKSMFMIRDKASK